MLDQSSQWYKLQYPECFVDEEARMVQKVISDFVDKEIIPVRDKIDDDVTHEEIVNPILQFLRQARICLKVHYILDPFQPDIIPGTGSFF